MIYDLIIIGCGPAGMGAAIYAKRKGLNILMFEKDAPGGLLNKISEVDNYPGYSKSTGPELAMSFYQHLKDLDIKIILEEVINLSLVEGLKIIKTNKNEYQAHNVIIATGRTPKLLGLKNENELLGKGISRCALCDGNFFKGKSVAVVGGGNSALEEALYLSNISTKVYLIHRREEFRADKILLDNVLKNTKIEILKSSELTKINEKNGVLDSIEINHEKELEISGLFLYPGYIPKVEFDNNLIKKDEQGYILVDNKYQTNVKGIYAVGDIIKKEVYQIINATSEGCLAAINVSVEKED